MPNKRAYFQGGGGVNQPTPGKKKYKSDPAIVVQPRFEEPLYRNYDLYTIPGMEDIGPGTGYHGLQNYKSVKEFLEARRKRLAPRYVADDSWQIDNGQRVKKNPDRKARMVILGRMLKLAEGEIWRNHNPRKAEKPVGCKDSDIEYTESRDSYYCKKCGHLGFNGPYNPKPTVEQLHSGKDYTQSSDENDGPNFDYGKGLYSNMDKYKSVKDFEEHADKGPGAFFANDENNIDFPVDEEVNHDTFIRPEEGEYHVPKLVGPAGNPRDMSTFPSDEGITDTQIEFTSPQIAGEHSYLPEHDFDGRSDDALNFGRNYDDESAPVGRTWDENSADSPGGCPNCGWLGDPKGTVGPEGFNRVYDVTFPCGNCGKGGPILDNFDAWDELLIDLEPAEAEIYGLPDGVEPEAKDAVQTIEHSNPQWGIPDAGRDMYEDKWNI